MLRGAGRLGRTAARCLTSRTATRCFSSTPADDTFKSSFNVPPPKEDITDKYLEKMARIAETMAAKPILLKGIKYNGTTKRFYEKVDVKEVDNGFAVTVAGRLIATSLNKIVAVPSLPLARAIAHEWDSQVTFIKPHTMPLMHVATLALDQVPVQRESMVSNMLGYIHTDAACIRDRELQSLTRLQNKHWDPVLEWMKVKWDLDVQSTPEDDCSINIVRQSDEVVEKMEFILDGLTDWELAILDSLTAISKSLCVSLAILHGQLEVKRAYECCRLEENFQMRRYGRVDGLFGHGIDIEYVRMKIAASTTFVNLLRLSDPQYKDVLDINSTNEEERSQRDLENFMGREYSTSF